MTRGRRCTARRSARCGAWLAAAAALLGAIIAVPAARAQNSDEQRIKELEYRIYDVESKLWTERMAEIVDRNPTCTHHKIEAKRYYDQALALNEQYSGRATADYQRQITEVKTRNQEHLQAYTRCFAEVLTQYGRERPSIATYQRFGEFANSLDARLSGAPRDLRGYLAQLKAEYEALTASDEGHYGWIEALSGPVEVLRNGRYAQAAEGMELLEGDSLRTGPDSLARLRLDGCLQDPNCEPAIVDLSPNTQVKLTELATPVRSRTVMEILWGALRSVTSGWGNGSIFNVRAGTTVLGRRGTDMVVRYDPQSDRVDTFLHEGRVEVTTQRNGSFMLQAGQQVTVRAGAAGPLRALDAAGWAAAVALIRPEIAPAAGVPSAVPVPRGDTFGAMYYSEQAGNGGFTFDVASRAEAESRALARCQQYGASDCRLLIWFSNACGAFARATNRAYGAAWASSQAEADRGALRFCRDHGGGDCAVLARSCPN